MRTRARLLGTIAAAAVAVGIVPVVAGAASASTCGVTWGSSDKTSAAGTQATLAGARTGRHDCYDRLVIDLAGKPAAGYHVRYIQPLLRADGSGDPLLVAGGAVLQVIVRAPAYTAAGVSTVPWPSAGHPISGPTSSTPAASARSRIWSGPAASRASRPSAWACGLACPSGSFSWTVPDAAPAWSSTSPTAGNRPGGGLEQETG